MAHTPEKLNLWDRLFNRYRIEVHSISDETWNTNVYGITTRKYHRDAVTYKKIDRLTGSETLYKEYLD